MVGTLTESVFGCSAKFCVFYSCVYCEHCVRVCVCVCVCVYIYIIYIYRVEQEECARLREGVPYVKLYRYNPKHLYPKLNGLGDNGN